MFDIPKREKKATGILYARGLSMTNLVWVKNEAVRLDRTLVNYMDTLITMVRKGEIDMATKTKAKKKVTTKTTTKKKVTRTKRKVVKKTTKK